MDHIFVTQDPCPLLLNMQNTILGVKTAKMWVRENPDIVIGNGVDYLIKFWGNSMKQMIV